MEATQGLNLNELVYPACYPLTKGRRLRRQREKFSSTAGRMYSGDLAPRARGMRSH